MPTLTIKNIPEDLYAQLKRRAEIHRRSLNSEVIFCLEQALRSRRMSPEDYIHRARRLRAKTARHPIRDEEFNAAKGARRP